jgi:hypothetical protein
VLDYLPFAQTDETELPGAGEPRFPDRYAEDRAQQRARPPQEAPSMPAEPVVWHKIHVQIRSPDSERDMDGGAIAQGRFCVLGGELHVDDAAGRRLGTQVLRPGDNAEIAAKKILREKHDKHSEFYAPIRYLN